MTEVIANRRERYVEDHQIVAITKEPNAPAKVELLPASAVDLLLHWESPAWAANQQRTSPVSPEEFASTWGQRLRRTQLDLRTVYRPRPLEHKPASAPLLLFRESQADFSPLNITLPLHVQGTLAIVNPGDSDDFTSLRDDEIHGWLQWTMLVDARVTEGDAIYSGVSEGVGYDRVYVERTDGQTRQRARTPLTHYPRHSRLGFSWGHMGDGPADLALAILVDVLALTARPDAEGKATFPEIDDLYQAFKSDVVSHLANDLDGWRLRRSDILRWLQEYPPSPVCPVHGIVRRRADGRCPQCPEVQAVLTSPSAGQM